MSLNDQIEALNLQSKTEAPSIFELTVMQVLRDAQMEAACRVMRSAEATRAELAASMQHMLLPAPTPVQQVPRYEPEPEAEDERVPMGVRDAWNDLEEVFPRIVRRGAGA